MYSDINLLFSRDALYILGVFILSPKVILCVLSILLLAKAATSFTLKTFSAKSFRKKIAIPHGFSEGVMSGMAYPLLIISLALLLVQTVLFIVLPIKNEPAAIARLSLFIVTFVMFICFDKRTPALRAYWFGKNAMWETQGKRGRIAYSDIYSAKVSPKISLSVSNGQQLCKISFFVEGKKLFFGRKKYVCRMTAFAINELANQVEFNKRSRSHAHTLPFKKRVLSFVLSIVLTLMTVSLALPCFSFGILNNVTYSDTDTLITEPLKTVAPITYISFIDGNICVYYENLETVELYSTDGSFVYAINFPASKLKSSDFSVKNGSLNYRYGDTVVRHYPATQTTEVSKYLPEHLALFIDTKEPVVSDTGDVYTHDRHVVLRKEHGTEEYVKFISRSSAVKLFDIEVTWTITAMLLTLAFVIHFMLTDKPKNVPVPRPAVKPEPQRTAPPVNVPPPKPKPPKKGKQKKEKKKKGKKAAYDDSLPDDWMI